VPQLDECFVCDTRLRPFIEKDFGGAHGLDRVHYERCPSCGLVISRTHYEMSDAAWGELNESYHLAYQGTDTNEDDPRWLERQARQAQVLAALHGAGVAPARTTWLDYAAGDGSLADDLAARGVPTSKYERYLPNLGPGYLDDAALRPGGFDLVLTTCVFEHLRGLAPFEEIQRLVAPDGVMGLHTLIREEIPADPAWFYLLAVHCTFLTNAAMERLLERWGYASSLYHVDARLWCFSRDPAPHLTERVAAAGLEDEVVVSEGFVGYWN
jgi:hypothetical protein